MNQSLSVILPIHNAQDRLAIQVERLLDLLPDLTDRFEIMIIDDASTDSTDEVAADMSVTYPQVRVVRHPVPMGNEAAVETGMAQSQGDVVLVHDRESLLDESALIQMWNGQRSLDHLTDNRDPRARQDGLLQRLTAWGEHASRKPGESKRSGLPVRRRSTAARTVAPVRRPAEIPSADAKHGLAQSQSVPSTYCTSEF